MSEVGSIITIDAVDYRVIATRFPSLAVRASMLMAAKEVGNGYATVGRGD